MELRNSLSLSYTHISQQTVIVTQVLHILLAKLRLQSNRIVPWKQFYSTLLYESLLQTSRNTIWLHNLLVTVFTKFCHVINTVATYPKVICYFLLMYIVFNHIIFGTIFSYCTWSLKMINIS